MLDPYYQYLSLPLYPCLYLMSASRCYESKLKGLSNETTLVLSLTQENSIEFLVQSSLPYILLLMVRAHCCAPYPK